MWLIIEPVAGGSPRTIALDHEVPVTIGRDSSADVRLSGRGISRTHLTVCRHADGVSFVQSPGAIGTRLNGVSQTEGILSLGDILTLGSYGVTLATKPPSSTGPWRHFESFVDTMLSSVGAPVLLHRLLQGLLQVTEAERGYVLLHRGSKDSMVPVASHRLDNPEEFVQISSTITSAAIEARKVLCVEDSTRDTRCSQAISLAETPGPRAIVCAPLLDGEQVFGVVYVDGPTRTTPLTDDGLATFASATSLAGRLLASEQTRRNLVERASLTRDLAALVIGDPKPLALESSASHALAATVDQIAAQDVSVLITGETGTGKEVVASTIHRHSARRDGPFIALNCAALPTDLAESELFGVMPGAFTGASTRRHGRFELASGGTLFLDEVGELSPPMQVKLLRVLEERRCTPLGATEDVDLDFRLICATNADLQEATRNGHFRSDLFYRINAFPLRVPPLRERREDIMPLAHHFLASLGTITRRSVGGFSPEARQLLEQYEWPGNIRELRNACERALIIETKIVIRPERLPLRRGAAGNRRGTDSSGAEVGADHPYERALASFEARYFRELIERHDGDVAAMIEASGLSRATLYRRLARHGLLSEG